MTLLVNVFSNLVFRLWEKGIVPFTFDPDFGQFGLSYRKDLLYEAIQGLEEDTCLNFVNMTGQSLRNHPDHL